MKRNILKLTIPALACAMVFTGGLTAYAKDVDATRPIVSELPMAKTKYVSYSGKISSIAISKENSELGTITLSDETGDILMLTLYKSAPILDAVNKSYLNLSDIKEGDDIIVILEGDAPMTASLPPIVNDAAMIIKTDGDMGIKIDVFDKEFLSSDKELQINLGEESFIRDLNGSKIKLMPDDVIGKECAVIYSITTMSLPPQTPPDAVIILNDANEDNEGETAAHTESELVPLRETFEKLGYKVEWTSNTKPIKLVKGDVAIEITLGSKDFKVNGKVHTADKAAVLKDSVTFVDSAVSDMAK